LLRHGRSMERCRRAVQRPIASSAFTPGVNGVISFPVCAVRVSPELGEGRRWRGTAWPDR
jgi:hypothetical protein